MCVYSVIWVSIRSPPSASDGCTVSTLSSACMLSPTPLLTYLHFFSPVWRGGTIGMASELWSRVNKFDPRPGCSCMTTLGKLFTPMCPYHQVVFWYGRKPGRKQAHHAMHQPRIHGLTVQAGVWLRATATEISATLCVAWEGLDVFYVVFFSTITLIWVGCTK